MRYPIAIAGAFMLVACGNDLTPQEQATADARAVAEVEANQEPPPETLRPQPILYPDIEKHALFGAGCNFVPEGGGMGASVLAMADAASIKANDEVLRLAADKGSAQNPVGSWRKYDGREYSLTLDIKDRTGEPVGMESVNYPARVVIRDSKDRIVYEGRGTAQCGS